MTKKSKKKKWNRLTFFERWTELRRENAGDPPAAEMLEAIGRNPAKAAELIWALVLAPHRPLGKTGRPKKWGRTEQICAWLAVEIEVQLARKSEPRIGYKTAMQRYFRGNASLRARTDLSGDGHLEIKTVDIALANHHAGAAHLQGCPELAAKWKSILENEVARRGSAA